MESTFEIIYGDVIEERPEDAEIVPPPYMDDLADKEKIDLMFHLIRRSLRRGDRISALTYAFYLGEMVELNDMLRKIAK